MKNNRETLIEMMADAYRNYLSVREQAESMEYIFPSMEEIRDGKNE